MGKFGFEILQTLGDKGKLISKLLLYLFIFLIIFYSYIAYTISPAQINESDSLGYHIPIAESIAKGKWLSPPDIHAGVGYYPSFAESILAILILLNIPIGLFNVFSLILLFFVVYSLSRSLKLNEEISYIIAFSSCTLNSVLRLPTAQTVDIWVAIFIVLSIYFLENLKTTKYDFIKIGTSMGFLSGTKYSGIFIVFILLFVYSKDLLKRINFRNILSFLVPFTIFGLSWYLRNFILKNNPFYPGYLLIFQGHPNNDIQQWTPLKTLLYEKNGVYLFLRALNSEYLIWSLAYILSPIILFSFIKNVFKSKIAFRMLILGYLIFILYLFTPSWAGNLVSDLRYIIGSVIIVIISSFLIAVKNGYEKQLSLLAILSSFSVFTQLSYRPKLIIIWLLVVIFLNFKIMGILKSTKI